MLLDSPDEEQGICGKLLILISVILIFLTFPVAIFMSVKIVQEYERAVIFRLGRILGGGSKGPGKECWSCFQRTYGFLSRYIKDRIKDCAGSHLLDFLVFVENCVGLKARIAESRNRKYNF